MINFIIINYDFLPILYFNLISCLILGFMDALNFKLIIDYVCTNTFWTLRGTYNTYEWAVLQHIKKEMSLHAVCYGEKDKVLTVKCEREVEVRVAS